MAQSKENIVTHGMSGSIARMLTFSQRAGKTIVGKLRRVNTKPPTDEQLAQQERFRIATAYAKVAILDPVVKAAYAAKAKQGQTAYNVAMIDAFTAPKIVSINTDGYHGLLGDLIIIRATDDFKVDKVKVVIYDPAEGIIEQGNAQLQDNGLDWHYSTTVVNDQVGGSKIVVTALDLPENATSKEVVMV